MWMLRKLCGQFANDYYANAARATFSCAQPKLYMRVFAAMERRLLFNGRFAVLRRVYVRKPRSESAGNCAQALSHIW